MTKMTGIKEVDKHIGSSSHGATAPKKKPNLEPGSAPVERSKTATLNSVKKKAKGF